MGPSNRCSRTLPWLFCLLLCYGCATAFPFERLEAGMTVDAAREGFGMPEAIETGPGGLESCWSYYHEEQNWPGILFLFPHLPITFLVMPCFGCPWHSPYIWRSVVLLDFDEEKLVRWELVGPVRTTEWTLSTLHEPSRPMSSVTCFAEPPTCTSVRELRAWSLQRQ